MVILKCVVKYSLGCDGQERSFTVRADTIFHTPWPLQSAKKSLTAFPWRTVRSQFSPTLQQFLLSHSVFSPSDLLHSTLNTVPPRSPSDCTIFFQFFIHGSVHRDSILIRSNELQQYAGVYLLQNYSTCFGCVSHPSSGVHQTVTAASGTGHITCQSLIRPRWWKVVALTRDMTCTRSCSYSFMYSWRWVR